MLPLSYIIMFFMSSRKTIPSLMTVTLNMLRGEFHSTSLMEKY